MGEARGGGMGRGVNEQRKSPGYNTPVESAARQPPQHIIQRSVSAQEKDLPPSGRLTVTVMALDP